MEIDPNAPNPAVMQAVEQSSLLRFTGGLINQSMRIGFQLGRATEGMTRDLRAIVDEATRAMPVADEMLGDAEAAQAPKTFVRELGKTVAIAGATTMARAAMNGVADKLGDMEHPTRTSRVAGWLVRTAASGIR